MPDNSVLAAAMAQAFGKIEKATKSAENPHFKSKYADLGSVIAAIKPALIEHDLFFTQRTHPAENGVSVETIVHHASGEQMSLGTLFVPASKQDAHGFGSALTYARRYGLQTGFGVPAEDDDGNAAAAAPRDKVSGITKIKERLRRLKTLGDESQSLDAFEGLITTYQEDLMAIKEGKHEWWTGDGKDEEGYGRWINRRRKELADLHLFGADEQFTMCMETLEACTSLQELAAWYKLNGKYVEQLDHESFDKVNTRYDELKAGFQLVDTATVGG